MKQSSKKMVCIRNRKKNKIIFSYTDAKENSRENNSTSIEQDNSTDINNHLNIGLQKFRRRDHHHHHHHNLVQSRLNNSGGQQDKRNKHELRRKRRHSGEERHERNQRQFKV